MGQLRFGTDGVRGRALTELTTDYVALARPRRGRGHRLRRLVDRPRHTRVGPDARAALIDGLRCWWRRAAGMPACCRHPALAYLSARHGVPAAMITASHNPWHGQRRQDLAAGGLKLSDDDRAGDRGVDACALRPCRSRSDRAHTVDNCPVPRLPRRHDRTAGPRRACASLSIVPMVRCSRPRRRSIRRLGAEVIVINAEPNGRNINDHCGATHPAALSRAVVAEQRRPRPGVRRRWRSSHRGRPSRQRGRRRQDDRARPRCSFATRVSSPTTPWSSP